MTANEYSFDSWLLIGHLGNSNILYMKDATVEIVTKLRSYLPSIVSSMYAYGSLYNRTEIGK